ncbi:MAG: hypothetical protein ACHREM_13580 [Polyangiales bacterium]
MATKKKRGKKKLSGAGKYRVWRALVSALSAAVVEKYGEDKWKRAEGLARETQRLRRIQDGTTAGDAALVGRSLAACAAGGKRLIGATYWKKLDRAYELQDRVMTDTLARAKYATMAKNAGHKRSKKGATRKVSPAMKKTWAKGAAALKASTRKRTGSRPKKGARRRANAPAPLRPREAEGSIPYMTADGEVYFAPDSATAERIAQTKEARRKAILGV